MAPGNSYTYQVCAVNSGGTNCSAVTPLVSLGALPAAPSQVAAFVSNLTQGGNKKTATVTVTWTDNANNETGFTIRRATDANFTQNLSTFNVGVNVKAFSQTVDKGSTLYYSVRADNTGGSSNWVNAAPWPTLVPAQ